MEICNTNSNMYEYVNYEMQLFIVHIHVASYPGLLYLKMGLYSGQRSLL